MTSTPPTGTSLEGLRAFVTGGARGIGRAICLALADAGADVCVADARLEPFAGEQYYRLRKRVSGEDESVPTAAVVASMGRRAAAVAVDVRDPDAVRAAAAEAAAQLGPIDILVNNAGIVNNLASIAEMSPESWANEVAVNLNGQFHTVQALVPAMAERGFGRVVNIASVAAVQPGAMQPAYAASKAGVVAFTKAVCKEFAAAGVTANAVLPGLIGTPLVLSMPEHLRDGVRTTVPARRLGLPSEVAALVAWLASPAASFVNGVAIPCDGGMLVGAPGGLADPRPS